MCQEVVQCRVDSELVVSSACIQCHMTPRTLSSHIGTTEIELACVRLSEQTATIDVQGFAESGMPASQCYVHTAAVRCLSKPL